MVALWWYPEGPGWRTERAEERAARQVFLDLAELGGAPAFPSRRERGASASAAAAAASGASARGPPMGVSFFNCNSFVGGAEEDAEAEFSGSDAEEGGPRGAASGALPSRLQRQAHSSDRDVAWPVQQELWHCSKNKVKLRRKRASELIAVFWSGSALPSRARGSS